MGGKTPAAFASAMADGKFEKASRLYVDQLRGTNGSGDAIDPRHAADALVLHRGELPDLARLAPATGAERAAVHLAMDAFCGGDFDRAGELLRGVGLKSIFDGWKLFLKGLIAMHTGADEAAAACFERLPERAVPRKASLAFRFLLDGGGDRVSPDDFNLFRDVCHAVGRSDVANALAGAERDWRQGRLAESVSRVRRGVPGFPSLALSPEGTLTEFYYTAPLSMKESEADRFMDGNARDLRLAGGGDRHPLDSFMINRIISLFTERDDVPDRVVEGAWHHYLKNFETMFGADPDVEFMVNIRLGRIFSEKGPKSPITFTLRRTKTETVRNFAKARRAFEWALRIRPGDRSAHLCMLALLMSEGNKAEVNRKLDEISRLFPDDKECLLKNGAGCFERGAYVKAIRYLERVRELDPLDESARVYICSAYMRVALDHARKGDAAKTKNAMRGALSHAGQSSTAMMTDPALLGARLPALLAIAGEMEEAKAELGRVLSGGAGSGRVAFFAHCLSVAYQAPEPFIALLRDRACETWRSASLQGIVEMAGVISFASEVEEQGTARFRREIGQLDSAVARAMKSAIPPDVAENLLAALVKLGLGGGKTYGKLLEKMRRYYPAHAVFEFVELLDRTGDWSEEPPTQRDMEQLESIRKRAVEQGNSRLAADVSQRLNIFRQLLDLIDHNRISEGEADDGDEDWDDDDWEEEDDDEDESEDEKDTGRPRLGPAGARPPTHPSLKEVFDIFKSLIPKMKREIEQGKRDLKKGYQAEAEPPARKKEPAPDPKQGKLFGGGREEM